MDRRRKLNNAELPDFSYKMVEQVTANIEEYEKFLDFYSRFYKYNIVNALMIYGQNPDATAVGTYEQWKSKTIGRGVRRGAFPIKILRGQTWETAFDIGDTYGKAFTYKNSYSLTEQEKEKLISAFGLTDRAGSLDERIMKFAIDGTARRMQELFHENENFKSHFRQQAALIGYSAFQLIKSRYHLDYEVSKEKMDFASFQAVSAFEKINILQYVQPIVRNAILEMDKGIAQIQSEQKQTAAQIAAQKQTAVQEQTESQEVYAKEMQVLDPAVLPVVTILWSESEKLVEGARFSLADADTLFRELDEERHFEREQPGYEGYLYDKTKFRIDFTFRGERDSYEGRQDFGDGDGSLIDHIQAYQEYYIKDKKNPMPDDEKAEREKILNEFVPYMRLHCRLSEKERIAADMLETGKDLTAEQTAYCHAVLAHVNACRERLNAGDYHLPDPPQLADFQKEGQAITAERTDNNGNTEGIHTGREETAGRAVRHNGDGGRNDSLWGQDDSRNLWGLGRRPRQMGLDVGGMDDRVPSDTGDRADAGGDVRRGGNPSEQGNRGISGDFREELEREISPSDEWELSGAGTVRAGGEDVPRELSDARGEGDAFQSEISNAKTIGTRKLTPSVKWQENFAAITTLKELERAGRQATQAEQEALKRFSGFGSLPQVFDENNEQWAERRNQLKALLTKEEYDSLEESTLSAHYTSPEIIRAMYTALEQFGVKGGNILEPSMGNGAFFANMPQELKEKSKLYGVELNTITGRIAQQLYPEAKIEVNGFEDTKFQDKFFDAAVGNVPFGSFQVYDPKYSRMNLLIHDYFMVKSLDKLKADGVMAFVTSKGTMDKANGRVRAYLAERAELLGAVRLPNNAFAATSGDVNVTTDILFLKKRERPVVLATNKEPWIYTNKNADGLPINEYFINHPEMVLGKMTVVKGQYGREDTACVADGRNLSEALDTAIRRLGEEYRNNHILTERETSSEYFPELEIAATEQGVQPHCITADPEVKNYCYAVIDDKVYYRENDQMISDDSIKGKREERIKALVELREDTAQMLQMQLKEDISDAEIAQLQESLSAKYDNFRKAFGNINNKANTAVFKQDTDFPLVSGLEIVEENGETRKADIFTKRTLSPYRTPDHCEAAQEAYAVCLNEKRTVDLAFIAQLTGKSEEETITELRGLIYLNPKTQKWEPADEYLSGKVVDKLAEAEAAAAKDPRFRENAEALKAVQPKYIESYDIAVQIGAPWIDESYYKQFIDEKFAPYAGENTAVTYNSILNSWHVAKPLSRHNKLEAISVYGTSRMDAYSLLENLLNQRSIKVFDYYKDENDRDRRKLNKEETIAAREKADAMREEFSGWLFSDPDRRKKLTDRYNRLFNSERVRTYDGSFLKYQGMNEAIKLKPHQNDAVARILFGGNTLLAHTMGAGKTFAMTAAAMEMKRMGLAKKPMIIVPNHLVEQWTKEFKQLYPLANVLAAKKEDFEKSNRQRFCGRIATGDWDAVIMGHSSFEKIPVSREREEKSIQKQIAVIKDALTENTQRFAWQREREPIGVKQLRTTLKGLERNLKELRNAPKDNVITFEQLGVDALFVDEAHAFKNKYLYSKMQNIAGIQKSGSKKSTDLEMKCDYINERAGGERNVIFATGTPVSNSMAELYTMQSYLQKSVLREKGLQFFDNWAANFGQVKSMLEIAPDGKSFRMRDKFARFVAIPELMNDFRRIADIQTPEMLDLPVPRVKGGKPQTIATEASASQKAFVKFLSEVSEKISTGAVQPEQYNMLCVTTDGRLGALDMRAVNIDKLKALGKELGIDTTGITADRNPNGKLAACAEKTAEIYHRTTGSKGTQMIFSDIATPTAVGKFNAYDTLKEELTARGVKAEEIAFVHDAKNDKQKQELFEKVQNGTIRVLIGSTQKMGAGTNAQRRLVALHHADCPWRPSDLSQREGRIVRQGNQNKEVEIYNYVTKGTFDSYLWQIVENKQRFISQIMNNSTTARIFEDTDAIVLNAAEVKAAAMDDPLIRRKMELENEMQRLRVLERQYTREQFSLQDKIAKEYPNTIGKLHRRIDCLEKDIAIRNEKRLINGMEIAFAMTVMGKRYTDRTEAGEALLEQAAVPANKNQVIGEYMGMRLTPIQDSFGDMQIRLEGNSRHSIDISQSPVGMIKRVENALAGMDGELGQAKEDLGATQKQLDLAKDRLNKPFEKGEDLKSITKELNTINTQLDIGKESIGEIVEEVEQAVTMELGFER